MTRRHAPGRARKDLRGCTVLLVENDFDEARDTLQALQYAGASVIGPFKDSESTLRSIAANTPSCAILDIDLPDGRGVNVAAALTDKSVPVIFISSAGVVPREFSQAPVMQKPVEFRSLLRLIAQLSGKGWPGQ
jgi:FixJ family two-component response regulator